MHFMIHRFFLNCAKFSDSFGYFPRLIRKLRQ